MNKRLIFLWLSVACSLFVGISLPVTDAQESVSSPVDFSEVRAVLRKRCSTCHNLDEARGDLDLSSITSIEAGSASGPVIVPGKPNESLLYTVTAHLSEPVMPPNSPKLPGRELDLIKRWIEGIVPATDPTPSPPAEESPTADMAVAVASSKVGTDEIPVEPVDQGVADQGGADEDGIVPVRPLLRSTAVAALAVHPSRSVFATSGRGQAVLGDLESGEWVGAINFPFGEVTSLKFSRDGKTLLIGGGVAGLSGTVLGVDAQTGERKFQVADEVDTIMALDVSNDGRLLAVGGPSKVVRIYSVDSGEVVHTLRKHTDWVLSLAFSPDGLLLASGDRFGGVFVWSPDDGELFHTLPGHQGAVAAVAWNDGSEALLTGCEDGNLRLWNMHHGDLTKTWDAQVGPILSVAHSENNSTFVGGRNNKATLWFDQEAQKSTKNAEDQVVQVGLTADGKLGVLGDSLGNIVVVSGESGERLREMNLPVSDGGVENLLTRLEKMEREYLANVEIKQQAIDVAKTLEPAAGLTDSMAPHGGMAEDLESESAASLLERLEAVHGSLVGSLRAHEQMTLRLTTLRQTVERELENLAAAEQAGQQLLQMQAQVVEDSKRNLDELRTTLGSKVSRETLAERLRQEASLTDSTEKLLKAIVSQPHLKGSEEFELLQTLKQRLLQRTEATQKAIENVDR